MASETSKSAYLSPLCIRLTLDERARLEQEAGTTPLSAHVRSRLFNGSEQVRRTRNKRPVADRQALGRLLAELGNARLANNLNQLARAVNSGSLPVCLETETEIKEAYEGIVWMRQTLLAALALKPGDEA